MELDQTSTSSGETARPNWAPVASSFPSPSLQYANFRLIAGSVLYSLTKLLVDSLVN